MKNHRKAYHAQKYGAKRRNIDWQFTYDTWIEWWGEDIIKRGIRKGQLVMARYKDQGPYHPDNVCKITTEENIREAIKGRPKSEAHIAKMSANQLGKKASAETKAKMSATRLGCKKSAETKAKMSAYQRGKKVSEETKAKIAASWIIRKQKKEMNLC